jgi:outer membrane receptor protein involved in Fe transport
LEPVNGRDLSGHGDFGSGEYTVNNAGFYRGDRSRLQVNAAVSHHADDFMGSHDFKFGAEFIHVTQRDQYGYNGGRMYWEYYGEPYLAYDYEGYDINATLDTFSFYAQDSWTVADRLTINPGVRVDISRGKLADVTGTPYSPKPSIAPRIGFTFDVFGDHSTAFKGHWGRYYESAYVDTYFKLSSNISDFVGYYYDGADWVEDFRIEGGTSQYTIDPDLKQSYMDQLTFGIERELIKDLSLSVTYINRRNKNQIAPIDIGGEYEQVSYTDSEFTGNSFMVWNQINSQNDSLYFITNPTSGMLSTVSFTPYRKYDGIEVLLNKRFSNNWQLMASYVYSKAKGNFNNTYSSGVGRNTTFSSPNNQINAEGKLSNDPTHMLKIQGSVILPFGINLNANFSLITGNTYTMEIKLPRAIDSNRSVILSEARGSNRYPTSKNLDVRMEKTFKIGSKKLGILLDVFNVFNQGIITSYETQQPSFQEILAIKNPRAFRAGLRFWF